MSPEKKTQPRKKQAAGKTTGTGSASRTTPRAGAAKTARRTVRRKVYGERHIIGFLFTVCLLVTLVLATLLGGMVALKIPDIRSVSHYRPLQTSTIVDRHGTVIERIFQENRTVVPMAQMPKLLPKAFVAAEDGRFFEHPGLDLFSVLRAALINIKRGSRAHGGSTITQQVARSLLLTREKTYLRKFKEAVLAWRIDSLLSKEDILYIYLNQIYLGGGAHGVEAASQTYFDKHVQELTVGEMAVLAGLPQAPSRYSPLKHPRRAIKRQRYVLNRMVADGYIDRQTARGAFEQGLDLRQKTARRRFDAGYYTEIVKKKAHRLVDPSFFRSGITIHTNIDTRMQAAAVKAVRSGVAASLGRRAAKGQTKIAAPQGAFVALEACSGKVRAVVGGTDYSRTQYDRATMARRPAGSAFKPIVFSAALENGWRPGSKILDAPLSIAGHDNKPWRPKNYSGRYHGEVSLTEALTHSYNTAAVRLLKKVGLDPVHRLSAGMGIRSEMPGDLSLALGSVDVSLIELTAAYSAFTCGGVYSPPRFIETIEQSDGAVLFSNGRKRKRVLSQKTAKDMQGMLEKVITTGTGRHAGGLGGRSGGKTGTSDNNRDAWFLGFHDDTVAGAWVGYDQNETLGDHENGGRTAAPIWRNYMRNTASYR